MSAGSSTMRLWVGNSTETRSADGIWLLDIGAARHASLTASRQLIQARASFGCTHPHLPLLYVVSEDNPGRVKAYSYEGCSLTEVSATCSLTPQPCHIFIHPYGEWLYVAGYQDGTVVGMRLDAEGHFRSESIVLPHSGSGPNTDRQESSHAHFTGLSPCEKFIIVADLGSDQLRAYPIGLRGEPIQTTPTLSQLKPGFGPRHFAVSGQDLYVTGELAGQIARVTLDSEGYGGVITYFDIPRNSANAKETTSPSHIMVHENLLIVGVRGDETIVTFDLDSDLRVQQVVDTVRSPRHFIISGSYLIVAGQIPGELGLHTISHESIGNLMDSTQVPGGCFIVETNSALPSL